MREKNIKKPNRVTNWGEKTLEFTPDSVAVFAGGLFVLIRSVGEMVVLVSIPRRHIRGTIRMEQDGPGTWVV